MEKAAERRSYLILALFVPLLGAPLGLNGGPIFQILALENLGLSARQVGWAVGLGAVSIPFQILATRLPLRLAKRNLRFFVAAMTTLCLLMAWLVLRPGRPGLVIPLVITIAVIAELAVSVLFATSWQPLLSMNVTPKFRQRLNAQARAASSVLLIAIVMLVGSLDVDGRVMVLVAIAILGVALLPAVNQLRNPIEIVSDQAEGSVAAKTTDHPSHGDRDPFLLPLYAAIGLSVVPAWPFFVTYAADGFWPSANLGLIGAALALGSLIVAATWRPTEHRLLFRARLGTVVMLLCVVGLVPLGRPVSGLVPGGWVLLVIALAAGAGTAVRMALLEMVHARSTAATSVRILTMLDVVGSTVMQLSFLAAGYLISVSVRSTWPMDPFQLSLIAAPILLLVVLGRISPAKQQLAA